MTLCQGPERSPGTDGVGATLSRHAPYFLPEEPLDTADLRSRDAQRLQPTIAALTDLIQRYLQKGRCVGTGEAGVRKGLLVGLYGPLGQGKSTVLQALAQTLKAQALTPGWPAGWRSRRPRILKLDISHNRPEAIEHWFWTLLFLLAEPPAWLTCLVLGNLALWIAALGLGPSDDWLKNWYLDFGGLVIGLPLVVPLLETLVNIGRRGFNLDLGWLDRRLYRLTRWSTLWPDVLLIDDLDRARVEQQRSLLWSLHRRSATIDFAVVLAFDETELLASEPNPESPEELLRKVILLSFRMPARTVADAAWLATATVHQWADINPSHPLASVVHDARFAASLARAVILLRQVGPRRIKSLLQDTLVQAEVSRLGLETELRWDDLTGLLFLTALRQEWAAGAQQVEQLKAWLVAPDDAGLQQLLKPLEKNPQRQSMLQRLLADAQTFRPTRLGWSGIVAGTPHPFPALGAVPRIDGADMGLVLSGQTRQCLFHPESASAIWPTLRLWDYLLEQVALGYAPGVVWRHRMLEGWERHPESEGRIDLCLYLGLAVAMGRWAQWDAEARLQNYGWWLDEVLVPQNWPATAAKASTTPLHLPAMWAVYRQTLLRLVLGDTAALTLAPEATLRKWLGLPTPDSEIAAGFADIDGAESDWSELLPALAGGLVQLPPTHVSLIWRAVSRSDSSSLSPQSYDDLKAALRRVSPTSVTGPDMATLGRGTTLLALAWPVATAVLPQTCAEAVRQNLAGLASAFRDRVLTGEAQSVAWLLGSDVSSSRLTAIEWLDALIPLLQRQAMGVNGSLHWTPELWASWGMPLPVPLRDERVWLENKNWGQKRTMAALCLALASFEESSRNRVVQALLPGVIKIPASVFDTTVALDWLRRGGAQVGDSLENLDDWRARVGGWLQHLDKADIRHFSRMRRLVQPIQVPEMFGVIQVNLDVEVGRSIADESFEVRWDWFSGWEIPQARNGKLHDNQNRILVRRWLECAHRFFESAPIEKTLFLIRQSVDQLRCKPYESAAADIWAIDFGDLPERHRDAMDSSPRTSAAGDPAPVPVPVPAVALANLVGWAYMAVQSLPTTWQGLRPPEQEQARGWLRRNAVYLYQGLDWKDDNIETEVNLRLAHVTRAMQGDSEFKQQFEMEAFAAIRSVLEPH